MAWRVLVALFVVIAGFLAFNIYGVLSARGSLSRVPHSFSFGNVNGKTSVVEFLDYSCTPCRDMDPVITEAVDKNSDVRYTPLVVADPGSSSEFAAKITYAAGFAGKYKEAYRLMMTDFRAVDVKDIPTIAQRIGMDPAKLRKYVESEDVQTALDKSNGLFYALGGKATPTFFVGLRTRYTPAGMPTVAELLQLFKQGSGT